MSAQMLRKKTGENVVPAAEPTFVMALEIVEVMMRP